MESLARVVDAAIQKNDYASLGGVFSYGPSSWQSLGQGEQRSLAAHLVKSAVGCPGFLPKAFESAQMMQILLEALGNLPTTVEGAADNKLRQMIFDYKVNEENDYSAAARVLAGMRMEDDRGSVYFTDPAAKCDGMLKKSLPTFIILLLLAPRLINRVFSVCKNRRMFPGRRRDCGIRCCCYKSGRSCREHFKSGATCGANIAIQIYLRKGFGCQSKILASCVSIP